MSETEDEQGILVLFESGNERGTELLSPVRRVPSVGISQGASDIRYSKCPSTSKAIMICPAHI